MSVTQPKESEHSEVMDRPKKWCTLFPDRMSAGGRWQAENDGSGGVIEHWDKRGWNERWENTGMCKEEMKGMVGFVLGMHYKWDGWDIKEALHFGYC